MLALTGLVSVGLIHDWLAWNSARWEVGRRALVRGIDPWDIEGGVEWNGWFAVEQRPGRPVGVRRGPTLRFTRDWFPHVTGRYALAFSQPPGTLRRDSEPYSLWLLPGRREFVLIEPEPKKSP